MRGNEISQRDNGTSDDKGDDLILDLSSIVDVYVDNLYISTSHGIPTVTVERAY